MENTEPSVVLELTEQIQGFQVVGTGFLRMVGCDMEVAEVDQGMGHGGEIALDSLDLEHFPIALFRTWKIVHECTSVAKVPKRIRQRLLIAGSPIIGHSRLPGRTSLDQIAAMEKNPGAMFMIVGH